ncbi:MAG: HAD-IIA family hydrolase [Desulfovibrionaceae bacterium]|nr:HAD-IIA family hydrolase [Desulfovibrionaceae bacterium]
MNSIDWSRKRCVVLDLDGTVYLGNIPISPSVEAIQRNWNRLDFRFLSNNTSHSPMSYVEKLNRMGIPARLEQFLSPTTPLVDYLRSEGIKTAYVVGNTLFKADLAGRMPELAQQEEGAECVILAYDTELTYDKLSRSALLLQKPHVRFFATHPDLVCPSPEGPLPDVGSFLSLYETATGRRPEKIFGKPRTEVLAPVFAEYPPAAVVMAGDRLSTDKKLAENAGIDFILVLSGEATLEDVRKEERQPTVIAETLGHAMP